MKSAIVMMMAVAMVALFAGCKSSHQQGVKSNLRTQWTQVLANTENTTESAREVLVAEGLKDVKATSTMVDGMASGLKADGTKISVSVEKVGEKTSQVSVVVGTVGDPTLGAEITRKIKDHAESRK